MDLIGYIKGKMCMLSNACAVKQSRVFLQIMQASGQAANMTIKIS